MASEIPVLGSEHPLVCVVCFVGAKHIPVCCVSAASTVPVGVQGVPVG